MKRNIINTIVVISILLIGAFSLRQNFSRSFHHTFTKSTELSKENVEGISLGDEINSKKIVSKYGKITKPSHDNSLYNYYLLREGIKIATNLDNNKIIRFIVKDKAVGTEKGIRIGDKKDKIINLYGDNYYTRLEQGTNIIGYVDKDKKLSIEFWLVESSVVFYRLDYNFMS